MAITVELEGADRLRKMYALLGDRADETMKQALVSAANDVLNESKQLVPVDTGALRSSGRVDRPVNDDNVVSVSISYGGAAAPYAFYVHERMGDINWSKPGTGAKYLERPMLEYMPKLGKKITAAFLAALRKA